MLPLCSCSVPFKTKALCSQQMWTVPPSASLLLPFVIIYLCRLLECISSLPSGDIKLLFWTSSFLHSANLQPPLILSSLYSRSITVFVAFSAMGNGFFILFGCACHLPHHLAPYGQTRSPWSSLHLSMTAAPWLVEYDPPGVKSHYHFRDY